MFPLDYDSFLFRFPGVESRDADAMTPSPEGRVAGWICCLASGRFTGWWQVEVSTSKGWVKCDWQACDSQGRRADFLGERVMEYTLTVSGDPGSAADTPWVMSGPASSYHCVIKPATPWMPCLCGMGQDSHAMLPRVPQCGKGTSVHCVNFLRAQGCRLSVKWARETLWVS